MRTSRIIAAWVLLAIVSACGKHDDTMPIGFGIAGTKAVITDVEQMKTAGSSFRVTGAYSEGASFNPLSRTYVFDSDAVSWDGASWSYTPLRYWHEGRTYRFCAYWPASANCTLAGDLASTIAISGFVQDGTAARQTDLLLSGVVEKSGSAPSAVDLSFHHLLCNVRVRITKTALTTGEIRVTSLTLSNVKNKGDISATSTDGGATWLLGSWTLDPTSKTGFSSPALNAEVSVSPQYVYADEGGFLVLPQTVNPAGVPDADAVTLTVRYTSNGVAKSISTRLPQSTWELNRRLTYNLTIEENDKILFDVPVAESWGAAMASGTIIIK